MTLSRALAHIEKVLDIHPIKDADRIELVTVLGWHVIQAKGTVRVGDKVIYIEIDSKVPDIPEFGFMRRKDFKGKTMKMKGVVSQGLIVKLEDFGLNAKDYVEGQ